MNNIKFTMKTNETAEFEFLESFHLYKQMYKHMNVQVDTDSTNSFGCRFVETEQELTC